MRKVVFILILIFSSVSYSQNKYLRKSNWVNINYVNCIDDSLPCECFEFNSYKNFFTLVLDSVENSFYSNTYKIYRNDSVLSFKVIDLPLRFEGDKDSIKGIGVIKNDTLTYNNIEHNFTAKFIRNDTLNYFDEFPEIINKINQRLIKNGNSSLQEILKSDTLNCDCDIQYSINRIHDNKNVWVIEIQGDHLYIYNWKYPEEYGKRARKKLKKKIFIGNKY